jgi:hypothetical protein
MADTIIDLGRMVKEKYPQYAQMSDVEVGRLTKSKYPSAYGHFVDMVPGMEKLGDLPGVQAPASPVGLRPDKAPWNGLKPPSNAYEALMQNDPTLAPGQMSPQDRARQIGALTGAVTGGTGAVGPILGGAIGAATTKPENVGSTVGASGGLLTALGLIPGVSKAKLAIQGAMAGLGSLAGQTAQTGQMPTPGQAATQVGVGAAAGPATQGLLEAVFNSPNARRLYQSALKPPTGTKPELVKKIVNTGLKEEILPNEAGWEKANQIVKQEDIAVAKKVRDFKKANPGVGISPSAVAARVPDGTSPFGLQSLPAEDMATLKAAADKYVEQYRPPVPAPTGLLGSNGQPLPVPPQGPPRDLSPVEALLQKKANYKVMGKKPYGELKGADTEAIKGLSRGLNEELTNLVPSINPNLQRESDLLELLKTGRLANAMNRENNKQLIDPLGMTTVGLLAHELSGAAPATGAAMLAKHMVDQSANKARLAIMLNKQRQTSNLVPFLLQLGLAPNAQDKK